MGLWLMVLLYSIYRHSHFEFASFEKKKNAFVITLRAPGPVIREQQCCRIDVADSWLIFSYEKVQVTVAYKQLSIVYLHRCKRQAGPSDA